MFTVECEAIKLRTVSLSEGFFLVADELRKLGLSITLADYSQDMIQEAQKRLSNTKAVVADLRDLPFQDEFDAIFVIGRVFTHMLNAEDTHRALSSIFHALKADGVVFLDNYEDTKIQSTDYFNGKIALKDSTTKILRDSSTELVSQEPLIVQWNARYQVTSNGVSTSFEDQMLHRAFSRAEIKNLFEENGFIVYSQGDNFDETSFYTLAGRR